MPDSEVFWSAFADVPSKQSPQVPVPKCQDLPMASGMCSAPAAAHQRMVSRTAFQKMGSHQPGKAQNMLRLLMWHTGSVPLLSHYLKGLQLSNSLAQVVVFTLVVKSCFPAEISVAEVDCKPPLWGVVTSPLGLTGCRVTTCCT